MDWSVVGQLLASSAPLIGKVLGNVIPIPGAPLAAEMLGKIIAKQFGLPERDATPANVAAEIEARLKAGEQDIVKARINSATEIARAEIAGFAAVEIAWAEAWSTAVTKTTAEVNATMRLENQPDVRHPYYTGWRAASGWLFVFYGAIFGGILMYGLAASGVVIDRINAAWVMIVVFFLMLAAIVGVPIIVPPSLMPRAPPPRREPEPPPVKATVKK